MMTRKFASIRKAGPRAPAGSSKNALSDARGNGLSPARAIPMASHWPMCHLPRTLGEQIVEIRRQHDLVAPALAGDPAVGFQIVGRRGHDVGDGIDHVAAAVMVEIDGEALERGRHELRRAERAGPRPDQPIRLDVAARHNIERGEKLLAEIIAAAADAGERRRRAQHGTVAAFGAVIQFDAPDRRDDVMVDAIRTLDRGEYGSVLRQQFAAAGNALVADQRVEIIPGRFVELRLGIEQIHDAQVRRQPGGVMLEGVAADAAPLGRRPQAGDAIAEIGGGGADGVRRHQRMAGGAGLPAPFARSGRRRRSGNRRRRRRLKHPCQPIVFCQSLRDLLRRRGIGQADGDQQCGNTTKDWRGNSHERQSQLHRRSRLPACSICSCPMGHLLCYKIVILGLPRTIKPAAARVISSLAVPLAVPYRMRPAATRSHQFDAAIFRRAHARFVPNWTKIWATKRLTFNHPPPLLTAPYETHP